MLKRLLPAFAGLLALCGSVMAAGTIPLSMTQQLDQYGVPLSGCMLYTIQAGTTSTPQNAYKDTALTLVQPNPMVCDSSGRLPQFFLADGLIKIRLVDKLGNPQVTTDNVLVIGPSSGGGGGSSIDPTTIATTGDIKQAYGTQVITGWVRFNGRTIGNASSGATERANADTLALFLYLWAADPNLTVSGGRTTAAADYAANKTIVLPDARGRGLHGLDDMGNAASGRLTVTYFGGAPTTLGAAGGSQLVTLPQSALPNINLLLNGTVNSTTTPTNIIVGGLTAALFAAGTGGSVNYVSSGAGTGSIASTGNLNVGNGCTGCQTSSVNGNVAQTPIITVPPTILVTIYIKL